MQHTIQEHPNVLQSLAHIKTQDKLAHAYLFIGPREIGKSETALAAAKMLNCEDAAAAAQGCYCGQCANCKRITSGNHPDVHLLAVDEGEKIKIDQIRSVFSKIKLKSFFANKKIFIIKDADALTPESSNALLKTLEEPSANSLLILTTSMIEHVLPTVRSRCHTIRFFPMDNAELTTTLMREGGESEATAHFLSYFSEGCLHKAMRLQNTGAITFKNEVIDRFVLNPNSDDYTKKILTNKVKTRAFLDVLFSWTRDAILLKGGCRRSSIIHLDRKNDLETFQAKFSLNELSHVEESIVQMFKMLAENLNIKIPLMIIRERLWEN